jgi:hypothetical protein
MVQEEVLAPFFYFRLNKKGKKKNYGRRKLLSEAWRNIFFD